MDGTPPVRKANTCCMHERSTKLACTHATLACVCQVPHVLHPNCNLDPCLCPVCLCLFALLSPLCSQLDCHAEGINFNEFIAAMFDAQKLAQSQVAKLVRVSSHHSNFELLHSWQCCRTKAPPCGGISGCGCGCVIQCERLQHSSSSKMTRATMLSWVTLRTFNFSAQTALCSAPSVHASSISTYRAGPRHASGGPALGWSMWLAF